MLPSLTGLNDSMIGEGCSGEFLGRLDNDDDPEGLNSEELDYLGGLYSRGMDNPGELDSEGLDNLRRLD